MSWLFPPLASPASAGHPWLPHHAEEPAQEPTLVCPRAGTPPPATTECLGAGPEQGSQSAEDTTLFLPAHPTL